MKKFFKRPHESIYAYSWIFLAIVLLALVMAAKQFIGYSDAKVVNHYDGTTVDALVADGNQLKPVTVANKQIIVNHKPYERQKITMLASRYELTSLKMPRLVFDPGISNSKTLFVS